MPKRRVDPYLDVNGGFGLWRAFVCSLFLPARPCFIAPPTVRGANNKIPLFTAICEQGLMLACQTPLMP